jgi:hypothetical protein
MKKDNRRSKTIKQGIKDATADQKNADRSEFPFGQSNYKWLLIGIAFLLIGFLLMIGGGSKDPDVFNEGMFNFQRLTLAPILLFAGYIIGIYAILKKPKTSQN